ncbi:hypothetical protein ACFLRI_00870 [Bacteroidota bacterium]
MRVLLTLSFQLIFSFYLLAQTSTITSQIEKSNIQSCIFLDEIFNTVIIILPFESKIINADSATFYFTQGSGKSRDKYEEKDKNINYLISQNHDTLAILRNKKQIIEINDRIFRITGEEPGWNITEKDKTIVKILLKWDEKFWNISLIKFEQGQTSEILCQIIAFKITYWAKKRNEIATFESKQFWRSHEGMYYQD